MSEENDVIEVRFATSIDQADRIMEFVVRRSDILFDAQQMKGNPTRFYYLVPEASVEFDRVLYSHSLMPLHRRLACVDPDASQLRMIPSAARCSFANLDSTGLAALIERRQLGDRKGHVSSDGINVVISVANLMHLSSLQLKQWLEHAFEIGIKYVVALVDPSKLASIEIKPKEIKGDVALFMQ
jgi:hypothetical protein